MSRRLVVPLLALVLTAALAAPVAAAKKPRSCTILKPKQMTKVLGDEVSGPGDAGTGDLGCSFDVGPGLGEPGGGIVIVTYYSGTLASSIWDVTEPMTEPIEGSKARLDPNLDVAYIFRKKKLVGVSVAYTSDVPPAEEVVPLAAELAELAAKRL